MYSLSIIVSAAPRAYSTVHRQQRSCLSGVVSSRPYCKLSAMHHHRPIVNRRRHRDKNKLPKARSTKQIIQARRALCTSGVFNERAVGVAGEWMRGQPAMPPRSALTNEFLARDSIYAIARSLPSPVRLSVCLSVRPSVTWVDQSKTVHNRITQSSPQCSPMTLVSWGRMQNTVVAATSKQIDLRRCSI